MQKMLVHKDVQRCRLFLHKFWHLMIFFLFVFLALILRGFLGFSFHMYTGENLTDLIQFWLVRHRSC